MRVSISWLKELVDYKLTAEELAEKLSITSIGVKSQNKDYLELDLTYNRGDLLSTRGVAREVAAITDSRLRFAPENEYIWDGKKLPKVKVEVQDNNLCPLYCVAKIEGLRVEPSSKDCAKKLVDCGVRSIDNITDITNLIMLEYGQTIHAFDAAKVTDETMIIRLARKGEQLVTLDGKTRNLTEEDLLITDPDGILSLSGIMGGKDSEITEKTHTILLEVAIFDPVSIRKSSQKFGLHSEASKRIQHGLTKTNLLQALSTAIKMYESLGGKLTAINLAGDLTDPIKKVGLTQKKLNSLIGVEIKPEEVETYLKKLGFRVTPLRSVPKGYTLQSWGVTVSYWRLDIDIEEDLIEEVARMYGYDKIEGQPLKDETTQKLDQTFYNFIYDLKVSLKNAGLTEVQTYSFYSTAVINALGWNNKNELLVKIENPISEETEYLRQSIWPNLVEVVGRNLRKSFKDIAIFEIGKAFNNVDGNPTEDYRLAIALCNGSDNPAEELLSILRHSELVSESQLKKIKPPQAVKDLFHPNRFVAILPKGVNLTHPKGVQIGELAEVHLRMLNKLGIKKRVAVLEIELEPLL